MTQNKTDLERKVKSLQWTQLLMVLVILVLVGAMFNLLALATNDGRMPVKTEGDIFNSEKHFSYQEDHEVNSPHFSDRFNLWRFYISIGDVIMILSAISVFIITGVLTKRGYNERTHRKQSKRARQKN